MARGSLFALAPIIFIGVILGPALPHLHRRLLGQESVDYHGTIWFYWFVERQLLAGESMVSTDLLFFPHGKNLLLDTGLNMLDGVVALPFRLLAGPVLGTNIFILAGIAAGAFSFYILAREFSADRVACALGGLLFAFAPYSMVELAEGRPTQALTALLPLFLLHAWRTGPRPGWGAPLAAGALLALTGYQYWFYALFSGACCLALALSLASRPVADGDTRWRVLARFGLLFVVALALAAPVAVPVLQAVDHGEVTSLLALDGWPPETSTLAGEFRGLEVWQPLHLSRGIVQVLSSHAIYTVLHYTPTMLILLGAAGLYMLKPGALPRRALVAMLLVALSLALGPLILFQNAAVPNPVYMALVWALDFSRRLLWPGRAQVWILLPCLLALVCVLGRLWAGRLIFQLGISSALLALWAGELRENDILPLPTWVPPPTGISRCLAEVDGAVISLPIGKGQAHLYHQSVHGKPIMGGMAEDDLAMVHPDSLRLWRTNSWLGKLLHASRGVDLGGGFDQGDMDALHGMGFRYVLMLPSLLRGQSTDDYGRRRNEATARLEEIIGPPIHEDGYALLYAPWGDAVPCQAGRAEVPPMSQTVDHARLQRQEARSRPLRLIPPPRSPH